MNTVNKSNGIIPNGVHATIKIHVGLVLTFVLILYFDSLLVENNNKYKWVDLKTTDKNNDKLQFYEVNN